MKKNIKYYEWLSSRRLLQKFTQILADLFFSIVRYFAKLPSLDRNSICVVSIHKLGDSIFTFDAIYSIKKFYDTKVFILCSEDAASIYQLIVDKKSIIPLRKKYFHFGDRYADSRARKILRKLKPEIIIDLTGVMTSATLIYNSRAKKIIGFNRKIFRSIYDIYSEFNLGNHSRQIYTNPIKNYIPIHYFRNSVRVDNKNEIKRILICPFAGWKSKEWPINKFIEIGEMLTKNYEVFFVFDDNYKNNSLFKYLEEQKIQFVKTQTTEDLISEIKSSDLVIGNDSGPVQIAAVLGKFTFSIYGPTNPVFHLPEGNKNFYIQKILPCSPSIDERLCFTDGGKNGCPSFECLNLLTVDEVYKKLISIIKNIGSLN